MTATRYIHAAAAAFSFMLSATRPLNAQPATLRGQEAFGDWQRDKPGTTRLIKPEDLPKPGATPSAANMSRIVSRPASAKPVAPALRHLSDRLSDLFETRVKVEMGAKKGKITVEFATIDDLERIVKAMSPEADAS